MSPKASDTLIVTVAVPAVVGVPEITPVLEMVKPLGKPVAVQVWAPKPPDVLTVSENALPTLLVADAVMPVIAIGTWIVMLPLTVEVCPMLSFTLNTGLNAPPTVGVPETTPPV